MKNNQELKKWFEKAYVKYGDVIFDILTVPENVYSKTLEQVKFITKILKTHHPTARRILDIPCGDGRISIGLLEKGYEVTGVDISPSYILKAREKVNNNPMAKFIVADMREIEFKEKFDVVINWFGSFGYFDDETNEKVLDKFVKWLNKDGLLLLDITNRDYIIQKNSVLIYEWRPEIVARTNNGVFFIRYSFDPFTNRITLEVKSEKLSEPIYYHMRYYQVHELVSMLQKRDMEILEVYGDYLGNKYVLFSPRIIIVARKK